MKIHAFKALFADKKKIKDLPAFSDDIKRNLEHYKTKGFFTQSTSEKLYVTEIKNQTTSYHGLVCLIDYEEMDDHILKHEDTRISKEKEVISFLTINKTMVKPILLAIDKITKLDEVMAETVKKQPSHTYSLGEEIHKYWALSDEQVQMVIPLISKKLKLTYIADGHHRFSTISQLYKKGKIRQSEGILSVLFSFDQLDIKAFTRIVKAKVGFMNDMKKHGSISSMEKGELPVNNETINFFYRGLWYQFKWNNKIKSTLKTKLNIELFTKKILKDVFHIQDERTSTKIDYLEGNYDIDDIEHVATMDKVYFTFNPISKKEFRSIINVGKYLPPKATWFSPRIKSGLINADL